VGLKELKPLQYTILQIKTNNTLPEKDTSKFLKYIEKDYDNKLGFETKMKEIKDEISSSIVQIFNYRTILQSQPITGSVLSDLFQKEMNEYDIININHLIKICTIPILTLKIKILANLNTESYLQMF